MFTLVKKKIPLKSLDVSYPQFNKLILHYLEDILNYNNGTITNTGENFQSKTLKMF